MFIFSFKFYSAMPKKKKSKIKYNPNQFDPKFEIWNENLPMKICFQKRECVCSELCNEPN